MGLIRKWAENSLSKKLRSDPMAQSLIRQIEGYGRYDGSLRSESDADRAFRAVEQRIGCANPYTKTLYRETYKKGVLPYSLCAAYAFAIGEYIQQPYFTPINLNTEQAQQNIMSVKLFFPDYRSFVESRHRGTEQDVVFGLTGNMLEYFL